MEGRKERSTSEEPGQLELPDFHASRDSTKIANCANLTSILNVQGLVNLPRNPAHGLLFLGKRVPGAGLRRRRSKCEKETRDAERRGVRAEKSCSEVVWRRERVLRRTVLRVHEPKDPIAGASQSNHRGRSKRMEVKRIDCALK